MSFYISQGFFKGRKLFLPPEKITRPTKSQARQGLFKTLIHSEYVDIMESTFLDAFSGSGALGIESLSSGAKHVTFIEKNRDAFKTIIRNTELLNVNDKISLIHGDLFKYKNRKDPVGVCFIDPPYQMDLWESALSSMKKNNWINHKTFIVIESPFDKDFSNIKNFSIKIQKTYGDIGFFMGFYS